MHSAVFKVTKANVCLEECILWDVGQDSDCPGSDTCINSLLTVFAGGTTMGLTLPAWQIVAAANEGKGSCRPWARDVTLELTCCQHPPAGHWQDSNNALLAYMAQFLEQDCEWLVSTGT